jgi:putative transposase
MQKKEPPGMSRIVVRGYKTELDINNAQKTACLQHAGAARWAYNWGLKRKQEVYEQTGKSISAMDLHKELNQLKQTIIPWMYAVSKCAPQESLRDLDKAFARFFGKATLKSQGKHQGTCGYPRVKSRKKGIGSFRLTGAIHVFEDAVQLPRLGRFRLHEHGYLPVQGKILSATISHQAGRWFVSVQVQEEHPDPAAATGTPLGIDLGIKALATVSDGRTIENPKALKGHLKKLRHANKRLHRRKKGSKNRKKAAHQVACLHAHIANIRTDTLHKATSLIVAKTKPDHERPSVIVLEDLNVSGMLKNRCLSCAISDMGWSEFRRQITYKAEQAGCALLLASRWLPSSKTCSCCGWVDEQLTLADRLFVCQECGLVIDRDLNAARNLVLFAYDSGWFS